MPAAAYNSGSYTAGQTQDSFASALTKLMPNGAAPLFLLLSQMEKKTAKQIQHGFWTETMPFVSATVNAAQLSTDTTITVVSTTGMEPGDMLRNQTTGENLRVLTIVSATQFTCTRGVGTVAAAAMSAAQKLYGIGSAFEEGSNRPNGRRNSQTLTNNLTQIFRNSWAITGTAAATRLKEQTTDAQPLAKDRKDAAAFHARDMEAGLWFGQKFSSTVNGQPFHTMDGVYNSVLTAQAGNIVTAGGTTTYDQLETMLDPAFDMITDPANPSSRILFAGSTACKVINGIGRKLGVYNYQANSETNEFGMRFERFKTTRGEFMVVQHPLFNSNADWQKMAVALDLSCMSLAYLEGRDTQHKGYGADGNEISPENGMDSKGGTFTSEMTLEFRNPKSAIVINGLTAAA